MQYMLTFEKLHIYNNETTGINIPVELSVGQERVIIPQAKLDTGASFCIFQKEFGESLGLTIESGLFQRIDSVMGVFPVYGHEVSLSALGFEFYVTVYFATFPSFKRNVLGRIGWLDQIRLGLIDYDGKLYASKYDDPT